MSNYGITLTGEDLTKAIKTASTEVKALSKGTIINRWDAGKPLTKSQFDVIKSLVTEPKNIKEYQVTQILTDKMGNMIGTKKVTKFVNKAVIRSVNAMDALPEDLVINIRENQENNSADLEDKNFVINHARGELSAMKAVMHRETATKLVAMRESKAIQKMSFDQIYAASLNKLNSDDATEHALETAAQDTKMQKDLVAERMLHPISA